MVSDGTKVALACIHKRFGRPVICTKEAELTLTDFGVMMTGGEYEEVDAPNWWFEWQLTDVNGQMTYAGGHETGNAEVDFIPTHWLPLPAAMY